MVSGDTCKQNSYGESYIISANGQTTGDEIFSHWIPINKAKWYMYFFFMEFYLFEGMQQKDTASKIKLQL